MFVWEEQRPLDPVDVETAKASRALHDYYRLGIARSLAKLAQIYHDKKVEDPAAKVPTQHVKTLGVWSAKFDWQKRILAQEGIDSRMVDEAFREEQLKAKAERLTLLRAQKGILAQHINLHRTAMAGSGARSDMDFGEIARTTKTLFSEERSEYGEIDTIPITIAGPGGGAVRITELVVNMELPPSGSGLD